MRWMLLFFFSLMSSHHLYANWDYVCYYSTETYGPEKFLGIKKANNTCNYIYGQSTTLGGYHMRHHGGSQVCVSNGAVTHGGAASGILPDSPGFYIGGIFIYSHLQTPGSNLEQYANEKNVCGNDVFVVPQGNTFEKLSSVPLKQYLGCEPIYSNRSMWNPIDTGEATAKRNLESRFGYYQQGQITYERAGNQLCAYRNMLQDIYGYRAVCYAGTKKERLVPAPELNRYTASTLQKQENYFLTLGANFTCP